MIVDEWFRKLSFPFQLPCPLLITFVLIAGMTLVPPAISFALPLDFLRRIRVSDTFIGEKYSCVISPYPSLF